MARLHFTPHLQRFFPTLRELETDAPTVAAALVVANAHYPGLAAYLIDERGQLRPHVALYLDDAPIRDRTHLSDPLPATTTLHIFQALSGG